MFQLIVAVISIALVAALAIASIYYGGTAFNQGTLKANVTTLVNAGQQISGAQALYVTEQGARAASITSLVNGVGTQTYLAGQPATGSLGDTAGWSLIGSTGTLAYVPFKAGANTTSICAEVVKQSGSASPQFFCSDATGVASASPTGLTFKL